MERHYFAYGSNMNEARMIERRAPYSAWAPCVLEGYTLLFNKAASSGNNEGYANVVPQEGGEVHGIVYRGTEETLGILDGFEGVTFGHYQREIVEVEIRSAEPQWRGIAKVTATVYIAQEGVTKEGLLPSQSYLNHLLQAKGLPEEYLERLRSHPTLKK